MSDLVPARGNGLAVTPPQSLAEQPPPVGNLAAALAAARDRCKQATKDGYNRHHGYAYASADEVIATGSAALNGSGLSLLPLRQRLTTLTAGNTVLFALNRSVLLAHDSGETARLEVEGWPVIPDRGRSLDKAFAIALTSSYAYLVRDLLQMPRGDASDDVAAQNDRATPTSAPPDPETAGPTPEQVAAARLPTSIPEGMELKRRLTDYETKLAAQGLCRPGEMLAHVLAAGAARQLPQDLARWDSPVSAQLALAAVKEFETARRAAGGPQHDVPLPGLKDEQSPPAGGPPANPPQTTPAAAGAGPPSSSAAAAGASTGAAAVAASASPSPTTSSTTPNSGSPTPPTPSTGYLTEQEIAHLSRLARDRNRVAEVPTLCKIAGSPHGVLERVPRAKLGWLLHTLTTGLCPTAQVDRINALRKGLGIDPAKFGARLEAVYGVSSPAHLRPEQADQLEAKLWEAPRPQPAGTATATT